MYWICFVPFSSGGSIRSAIRQPEIAVVVKSSISPLPGISYLLVDVVSFLNGVCFVFSQRNFPIFFIPIMLFFRFRSDTMNLA